MSTVVFHGPPFVELRSPPPRSVSPMDVPGGPSFGALATRTDPQTGAPTRGVWLSGERVATVDGDIHEGDALAPWRVWLLDLDGLGETWLRRRVDDALANAWGEPVLPGWLLSTVGLGRMSSTLQRVEDLALADLVELARYIAWSRRLGHALSMDLMARAWDASDDLAETMGGGTLPSPTIPCLTLEPEAGGSWWVLSAFRGQRRRLRRAENGDTWKTVLQGELERLGYGGFDVHP